jgi:hypothetical protein
MSVGLGQGGFAVFRGANRKAVRDWNETGGNFEQAVIDEF